MGRSGRVSPPTPSKARARSTTASAAQRRRSLAVSRATPTAFKRKGRKPVFEYRDLGIAKASNGKVHADLSRLTGLSKEFNPPHRHVLQFHMVYVTAGWVTIEYEGKPVRLGKGDCVYQPPGINHRIVDASDDVEMLQITAPADYKTVSDT
jgi:quercetin dioxygenase-like cupin family protein